MLWLVRWVGWWGLEGHQGIVQIGFKWGGEVFDWYWEHLWWILLWDLVSLDRLYLLHRRWQLTRRTLLWLNHRRLPFIERVDVSLLRGGPRRTYVRPTDDHPPVVAFELEVAILRFFLYNIVAWFPLNAQLLGLLYARRFLLSGYGNGQNHLFFGKYEHSWFFSAFRL